MHRTNHKNGAKEYLLLLLFLPVYSAKIVKDKLRRSKHEQD